MNKEDKKIKFQITAIICACLALFAFAIIYFIIDSRKTATLSTTIAPSTATITINGKKYKPNEELRFAPANITATISADGFKSQDFVLNLEKDQTSYIVTYLIPENDDLSWYDQDYAESRLFLKVNNILTNQYAEDYATKYPISTILPITVVEVDPVTYDWTEYRIDSGKFDGCNSDFCIKITDTTGGNREKALNKIREKGFNPNEYQIIYEETPIQPLPQN